MVQRYPGEADNWSSVNPGAVELMQCVHKHTHTHKRKDIYLEVCLNVYVWAYVEVRSYAQTHTHTHTTWETTLMHPHKSAHTL